MTEVQSWVLIGVFASVVIGMMSWQTVHLSSLFRAEIGRATAELRTELATIDRDLQALTRRAFGGDDG